jgi:hypothetical protein
MTFAVPNSHDNLGLTDLVPDQTTFRTSGDREDDARVESFAKSAIGAMPGHGTVNSAHIRHGWRATVDLLQR